MLCTRPNSSRCTPHWQSKIFWNNHLHRVIFFFRPLNTITKFFTWLLTAPSLLQQHRLKSSMTYSDLDLKQDPHFGKHIVNWDPHNSLFVLCTSPLSRPSPWRNRILQTICPTDSHARTTIPFSSNCFTHRSTRFSYLTPLPYHTSTFPRTCVSTTWPIDVIHLVQHKTVPLWTSNNARSNCSKEAVSKSCKRWNTGTVRAAPINLNHDTSDKQEQQHRNCTDTWHELRHHDTWICCFPVATLTTTKRLEITKIDSQITTYQYM